MKKLFGLNFFKKFKKFFDNKITTFIEKNIILFIFFFWPKSQPLGDFSSFTDCYSFLQVITMA